MDAFGQLPRLDVIREIADRHGLVVIVDSCESLGSAYKGIKAGNDAFSHGRRAPRPGGICQRAAKDLTYELRTGVMFAYCLRWTVVYARIAGTGGESMVSSPRC